MIPDANENRIPYNEFSEICTGDMESMDMAYHYWLQDKYIKERKWYEENRCNKRTTDAKG